MKCSICGCRANSIKGMGAHYRKKHPKRMARKKMSVKDSGHRSVQGTVYAILKKEGLI